MTPTDYQAALRRPFPADRIEWRLQSCGTKKDGSTWAKCLAYIDNRAAMERLDDVFGPNWSQQETFATIGNAAVCTVSIEVFGVDGYPSRQVTGSCAVEANGDIDAFKSAASGAMKRAVVNLGVGRYLYDLPEAWADITESGQHSGKTKDGQWFKWNPPTLPDWALPDGSAAAQAIKVAEAQEWKPDPARYKPNTQAAQAPAATDGSDPWAVVIHFGKNKDRPLKDLPERTLAWYLNEWKPQPFKGRISAKDTALRAALDKIAGNASLPDKAPAPLPDEGEEVPF